MFETGVMILTVTLFFFSLTLSFAFRMEYAYKGDEEAVLKFPDVSAMMNACYPDSRRTPESLRQEIKTMDAAVMINDQNQPIAYLNIKRTKYKNRGGIKEYPALELWNGCVDPSFQGQGIPIIIFKSLLDYKKKFNLPGTTILGLRTNVTYPKFLEAVRAYLKIGFSYHMQVLKRLEDVDPEILLDPDYTKRTCYEKFLTVYENQINSAPGDKNELRITMFRLLEDNLNGKIRKIQRAILRGKNVAVDASVVDDENPYSNTDNPIAK